MRKRLWPSLLGITLSLSGCVSVQVPNTEVCASAGVVTAGAICAETITHKTRNLNFDEWIVFLEPNETRGGALCQSPDDYSKVKTALEEACRLLGSRCSYDLKQVISSMGESLNANIK